MYNNSDGLFATVVSPNTTINDMNIRARYLERHYYWWDPQGYQSAKSDFPGDSPHFDECGGALGQIRSPVDRSWSGYTDPRGEPCDDGLYLTNQSEIEACKEEQTWVQACEGCHCGFVPLPYGDIEWSSSLEGRLTEINILLFSLGFLGFFAFLVPLVLMFVTLCSFGSCAVYYGEPKYFTRRWESTSKCNGFVIAWGGLLFDGLRRTSLGFFMHLFLVVDMVHFALMTGIYRADAKLLHEHIRSVLVLHLTLVVVRVAYICATKPYIDPRKNRYAFVAPLYEIINDAIVVALFDGADYLTLEPLLLFWNAGFLCILLFIQAVEILLGPLTKIRLFFRQRAEMRQEQRGMLRMEIQLQTLENAKRKRAERTAIREKNANALKQKELEREKKLKEAAAQLTHQKKDFEEQPQVSQKTIVPSSNHAEVSHNLSTQAVDMNDIDSPFHQIQSSDKSKQSADTGTDTDTTIAGALNKEKDIPQLDLSSVAKSTK
jgi:hypothetical protein